jgi:uncharacterized protein (DUF1778 family)
MPAQEKRPVQAAKSSRVGIRVPQYVKRAWEDAAALEGRSLSDIIIAATTDAVAGILDRHRIIHVLQAGMKRILNDLQNPPEPDEALGEAAAAYREAVETGELVL